MWLKTSYQLRITITSATIHRSSATSANDPLACHASSSSAGYFVLR
jgi:hypothetical protein